MGRKSNMSAQSAAVIAQLRKLGAQPESSLLAAVSTDTTTQLKKRLANLRDNGWLQVDTDAAGTRLWSIRPAARSLFQEQDHAPRKSAGPVKRPRAIPAKRPSASPVERPSASVAVPDACTVAAPRIVHVMHGTYSPPRASAGRPGAHDFLAIRSQGVRC